MSERRTDPQSRANASIGRSGISIHRFNDSALDRLDAMSDQELFTLLGMSGDERIAGIEARPVIETVRTLVRQARKRHVATALLTQLLRKLESQ